MNIREAMDAFEMTARAEIIGRMADAPPAVLDEMAVHVEQGLAVARKSVTAIIKAVGGDGALAAWEALQERDLGDAGAGS